MSATRATPFDGARAVALQNLRRAAAGYADALLHLCGEAPGGDADVALAVAESHLGQAARAYAVACDAADARDAAKAVR